MTRHDMTEPNRSDFGAKLRTAREDRGVSLRQIAESTKISVATLEALESNDLEFLPGGIFTRSFVRNYASAVGLDPEESVREFLAQASAEPMFATRNYADDAEDQRQYLSQQRIARIALLIHLAERPDCGALALPRVATCARGVIQALGIHARVARRRRG